MSPPPKVAEARRPEAEASQFTREPEAQPEPARAGQKLSSVDRLHAGAGNRAVAHAAREGLTEPAIRPSSAEVANDMQAQHGNATVAHAAARTPLLATERPVAPKPSTAKRVSPVATTMHGARASVPRAEDLIAARYPHLARVLLPAHYKAVQDVINWRFQNRNLNQEIAEFDSREREKAAREGMEGNSYRYLSSYNDKLEKLYSKQKEAPDVTRIEVDTSKLIDRSILDEQDWNIDAERQFRESWVKALSSKPTVLELWGDHPIEDVFRGVFWNGVSLPTEGGLITWKKLLEIPGAFLDYNSRVLHSPVAVGAEEYLGKLRSVYRTVESEYDFERERKSGFPIVSRISEFFSSSIDWNAASKLLPRGKSFDDMNPFETMEFLGSLKDEQVDGISRALPTSEEVLNVYKHLLNVDTAVTLRKYEAALITMPLVADEIEEIYRKTMTYRQRTLEGASTVVTGLQYVRVGCNIVLTVGGGVMGKAYGLIGISAGSAAGAGIGTLTQETAMQLAEGRLDPGSVLFKTGKDAAMAFIGSMIGGALAGKFASVLGTRLATIIPNEGVRAFVIGRIADAGSGLITAPLEITVNGMLEGDWPKSMNDLAEKVATNVVVSVVVGGALDIVTGVPNLKGKAWESLTEADVAKPPPVEPLVKPPLPPDPTPTLQKQPVSSAPEPKLEVKPVDVGTPGSEPRGSKEGPDRLATTPAKAVVGNELNPADFKDAKLGTKLGSGGNKDVFEVAGRDDVAIGVLKEGKSAAGLGEEIALLNELKSQGIPTVDVIGRTTIQGRDAIVFRRFAQGSKDVVRLEAGKVRRVGESALLNERSIEDLRRIRSIMEDKKVKVDDLQFLIGGDGSVVVADPLKVTMGQSPSTSNKRMIDLLVQAAEENIAKRTAVK